MVQACLTHRSSTVSPFVLMYFAKTGRTGSYYFLACNKFETVTSLNINVTISDAFFYILLSIAKPQLRV